MKEAYRNAVIYHIFIDRFAGFTEPERWDKPEYIGGNLKGIASRLSYIKKLGATTIWLSPFYKGIAYHGYHITDFYKVDPHFGSEADLKQLIAKAHRMGLKVIADFVPNHCSIEHPFFQDAQAHKNSRYRDWFLFDEWPYDYRSYLDFKELAKLNLDNPAAMKHVRGAASKWLALGLDGYRLDHVIGLSNQNVKDLVLPLRREFPSSVFFGEAWIKRRGWRHKTIRVDKKWLMWLLGHKGFNILSRSYSGTLDGILSFRLAELFEQFALATPQEREAVKRKTYRQAATLPSLLQFTFLDSHDMERFLFRCSGDKEKMKKAVALQLSLKQPAVIYYGSEVGMSQKKPFMPTEPHTDLSARMPMTWDEKKWDKDLLEFYKERIRLKQET